MRISLTSRPVVRAALVGVLALTVFAASGCRGKKDEAKPAESPSASTPAAAPAAGVAKGIQATLKTDVQPLAVNAPVTPAKIDGLDVRLPAIDTKIAAPTIPTLNVALPQVVIPSLAVPSVNTSVTIAAPSLSSLMPSTVPGVIPTIPGGLTIPPGFIPPGFPTPPGN